MAEEPRLSSWQRVRGAPRNFPAAAPAASASPMSRKASEDVEYTLRSLSSLMGERRRRQPEPGAPGGERSLLAAESAASLQGAELERAARRQFQRDETPAFVYAAAAFSALGGFLFGYDTGVVSGAMLLLRRQMRLGAMWQELLVSGAVGAAAVAALAGGALNGALGRRSAILLASALCTVGSAVLAAAANKETLLAGRLVVGLGIGEWPRPRAPLTPALPCSAVLRGPWWLWRMRPLLPDSHVGSAVARGSVSAGQSGAILETPASPIRPDLRPLVEFRRVSTSLPCPESDFPTASRSFRLFSPPSFRRTTIICRVKEF